MTSSYCAPCIADLALVRDAVTSVSGTATCMAHAVLLTHSTDDPGRRRQRLDALRDLATGKAETAEPSEQVKLELLVQEYGLAGAMDMGGPSRRQDRPRGGGPGHGPVQGGHERPGSHAGPGVAGEERGRKSRRGRGRGEGGQLAGAGQPGGQPGSGQPGGSQQGGSQPGGGESRRDRRGSAAPGGETAPVTPAPGPAGEVSGADGTPIEPANVPLAAGPVAADGVSTGEAAVGGAGAGPAPADSAPSTGAPSTGAPSSGAPTGGAQDSGAPDSGAGSTGSPAQAVPGAAPEPSSPAAPSAGPSTDGSSAPASTTPDSPSATPSAPEPARQSPDPVSAAAPLGSVYDRSDASGGDSGNSGGAQAGGSQDRPDGVPVPPTAAPDA